MRTTVAAFALLTAVHVLALVPVRSAFAREVADCKARWGSAVRSYLTKNRRAGPSGKVPATIDEAEEVAMAWVEMFTDACKLEAAGKKRKARLMASTLGAATLARLDPVACQRFLHYFVKAKDPEEVCRAAIDDSKDRLQRRLTGKLKHLTHLTVPWVNRSGAPP